MSNYTDFLEYEGCDIYPEDDNYTEKLLTFAKNFRYFDEALTEFMSEHGYQGTADNMEEKIAYLKMKFENASIPVPRNLRKWFTEHKRIERRTAFQICFAFGVDVEETDDFFRKIYLERSFDCHYIEEAIYYYAMKHKLGYDKALELIKQAPEDKKDKIDFSKEVLFTSSIINEIDRFEHTEDLMKFFEANVSQFGYNNASAYQSIHEIWGKIAFFDGLAARERTELSVDILNTDSEKKANHLNPEKKQSIWKIYLQILGFDEEMVKGLNTDRSIKPILKDNKLLHPIAQDCFPDREGIQKILNGTHVSYDCVRKNMIFLVFYKYWVTSALKRKDSSYRAQPGEADRCFNTINKYLLDVGYPKLYLGNPFDWIFMYAMKDEFPLVTFREFMHELFMIKEEELGII